MKFVKYLIVGIAFGVVLSKSEVVSWYRIYEMFNFQSFHMYGVIGTAVISGALAIWAIKKWRWQDFYGQEIHLQPKQKSITRYLVGGTIFGLGWAMTGACPGPMFVLVGQGYAVFGLVIFSAMLGTFLYGILRSRLPH